MVTIYHSQDGTVRKLSIKELLPCLQEGPQGMIWVDMEDPQEAEEETLLISILDFHPLSIEDCQRGREEEGHLPKVEDFDDYLFVIFNPLDNAATGGQGGSTSRVEIKTTQLSAFILKGVLVTHHYRPIPSVEYVSRLCAKNPKMMSRGPDYLFHLIIDNLVDDYNPILDQLDEAVDSMENEVFHSPTQETMVGILFLKRNIMTIRRIAVYQREMLSRLSRGEFRLITQGEMIYYRNVYDHLVRMSDLADSYRDMVAGLLDAYLSVTSNRLNQVMKVLTIISTIFLPLSVITGFFGMNFRVIPLADWEFGMGITAIFMLVVALGMLWVFKRRGWL